MSSTCKGGEMLCRVLNDTAVSDRRWLGRIRQVSVRALTIVCCLGLATGYTQSGTSADDGGGTGVSGTETTSGGNVQTGQSVVYFPTWDAPENISTAALLDGELVIGADDCLYLRGGPGESSWAFGRASSRGARSHRGFATATATCCR